MPIWNDHNAQLDFYSWLERHQQEKREEDIRVLAKKYATGQFVPTANRAVVPWVNQRQPTQAWSTGVPAPATMRFRYNDIVLDIHPDIQGFPRQLLAEMAIREQLDDGDEPGDM